VQVQVILGTAPVQGAGPCPGAGHPRDRHCPGAGHLRDLPGPGAGDPRDHPCPCPGHLRDHPCPGAGHHRDHPCPGAGQVRKEKHRPPIFKATSIWARNLSRELMS